MNNTMNNAMDVFVEGFVEHLERLLVEVYHYTAIDLFVKGWREEPDVDNGELVVYVEASAVYDGEDSLIQGDCIITPGLPGNYGYYVPWCAAG